MALPTPELRPASPDDPDATRLIDELNAELDALYRPDDNHFSLDRSEVAEGRGAFFVAFLEGQPVGCGAVRLIGEARAEIKRMYVRPNVRGRGVGRALLNRLESKASALGATSLVLEMGDSQPGADALYRGAGFREIPCWGEYLATPASVCLGKRISRRGGVGDV